MLDWPASSEQKSPTSSNLHRRQFIGFVAVGVVSACLSLLVRFIANQVLSFELSVILAHLVGMLFSFAVNRTFIFPATKRPIWDELAKYSLVNLVSLAMATGVSSWFYRVILPSLGIETGAGLIAHFLGLAACTLPSFVGHKLFSFRKPRPEEAPSLERRAS